MSPVWNPDYTVTACELCSTEFTFFFRRHHCRNWLFFDTIISFYFMIEVILSFLLLLVENVYVKIVVKKNVEFHELIQENSYW